MGEGEEEGRGEIDRGTAPGNQGASLDPEVGGGGWGKYRLCPVLGALPFASWGVSLGTGPRESLAGCLTVAFPLPALPSSVCVCLPGEPRCERQGRRVCILCLWPLTAGSAGRKGPDGAHYSARPSCAGEWGGDDAEGEGLMHFLGSQQLGGGCLGGRFAG